jgi:hypothetical protein
LDRVARQLRLFLLSAPALVSFLGHASAHLPALVRLLLRHVVFLLLPQTVAACRQSLRFA